MKKRISLVLAAALAWSLSACAATPEQSVVAQKNTERLVEAATDTEDENRQTLETVQEHPPEHYTFDYTSTNGKVHIAADAEVILPETDSIPMYQLSACDFTQEQAKGIFDYLFDGKQAWYLPEGIWWSKEEADERLLQMKQDLAIAQEPVEGESEDDRQLRESYIQSYEEDIASLEAEYDALPDSLEPLKIGSDGSFQKATTHYFDNEVTYDRLMAQTDDGDMLVINNPIDSTDMARAGYESGPNSEGMSYDENHRGGKSLTPEEAEQKVSCKYSFEEAKAIADGLLDAAGVEAKLVQVSTSSRYAEKEKPGSGTTQFIYEDTPSAYAFYYARMVDDTPVAVTTSNYIYHEDTAPVWLYESIEICVNDDGIAWMSWTGPVQVEETVSNDVSILPFETAAETFEQMSPLIYQGNVEAYEENSNVNYTYDVMVDRIELNLMRVRSSGDQLTGLYVPAWVFYGTESSLSHYDDIDRDFEDYEPSPWIILAVNAVDGTVIDVMAGY